MRFDGNGGPSVNYEPNSSGGPIESHAFKEAALAVSGLVGRYDHREGNDDYTQPGNLFRLLTPDHKARLIDNLVQHMTPVKRDIQLRQIAHFYAADPAYGEGVARGLGIDIREVSTPASQPV